MTALMGSVAIATDASPGQRCLKPMSLMIRAVTAAIILCCAGCQSYRPIAPVLQLQDAREAWDEIEKLESSIIAASKGRAERQETRLILRFGDRTHQELVSNPYPQCENDRRGAYESCISYYLIADIPAQNLFLIRVALYEGEGFYIVDQRNGQMKGLSAFPEFSPDWTRFVAISNFDNISVNETEIEIWRREKDGFVMEWARNLSADPLDAAILREYRELQVEPLGWASGKFQMNFRLYDWYSVPPNERSNLCWLASLDAGAKDKWKLSIGEQAQCN
jgi:hypothetical protein